MNVLERERKRRKLRPAEMARLVDVHRSHYGRIESGEKRASFDCAQKIAAALRGKVSVMQILQLGPAPTPRNRKQVLNEEQVAA